LGAREIAPYRRVFLIYNRFAGTISRRPKLFQRAVALLRESWPSLELVPTSGVGAGTALARECLARGADLVLAAGGDGTMNEVANGLICSDVPCGLLPGGTANVLAMEVRCGGHMLRSAQQLTRAIPVEIAVGKMTGAGGADPRHFLLMAGAGVDARLVRRVDPELKRRLGKVAYWVGGLGQLGRPFPEFAVHLNGRSHRASFALISRVRNYGGDLEIALGADLLSEEFEVVLFQGSNSFTYLKYLAGIFSRRLRNMRGVHIEKARLVECTPLDSVTDVQLDGEAAGELPSRFEIVPRALRLLLPDKFLASARQRSEIELPTILRT